MFAAGVWHAHPFVTEEDIMDEREDRPAGERREVVERREVIDEPADSSRRGTAGPTARDARAATVWLWMIPLLGVVVFLVWFILARGEPQRPFEDGDVDIIVPTVEPTPAPQRPEPEIQIPAPDAPAASPPPRMEPGPE
jgi:hypothetical protein